VISAASAMGDITFCTCAIIAGMPSTGSSPAANACLPCPRRQVAERITASKCRRNRIIIAGLEYRLRSGLSSVAVFGNHFSFVEPRCGRKAAKRGCRDCQSQNKISPRLEKMGQEWRNAADKKDSNTHCAASIEGRAMVSFRTRHCASPISGLAPSDESFVPPVL